MFQCISRVAMRSTVVLGLAFSVALPATADELASIKEPGKFSAAMSGQHPPFSMTDGQNRLVGFDVDIANEIANRLGVKREVLTTAWDGIIPGLVANRYDSIVGSMTITAERQKVVDFVGPYYSDGRGIFVLKDSTSKGLDDLKGGHRRNPRRDP